MGKEFVEYHSDNGEIPYSSSTLCSCLTQYARNYIAENRSIIANIDKNVRDAVLVEAIRYLGGGFFLRTKDLYSGRIDEETVDAQYLLTMVQNFYATYIFQYGIVESVFSYTSVNDCTAEFDANDGAIVLVDFINYLAQVNGYDRKFTIKDLYEKFKIQDYKSEMNRLKTFLEKTSKYSEKLSNGENIDSIFADIAKEHGLKRISKDGTYYYTDIVSKFFEQREMFPWDQEKVEEEIYAMSYAYGKMSNEVKGQPQTEIINKKMLEMKKR